jgi:hypothetical protein
MRFDAQAIQRFAKDRFNVILPMSLCSHWARYFECCDRERSSETLCLSERGNGHFTWIKSRLCEMGLIRSGPGRVFEDRIGCDLHFVWGDGSDLSPSGEIMKQRMYARSKLNKDLLAKVQPVDTTAFKVSSWRHE